MESHKEIELPKGFQQRLSTVEGQMSVILMFTGGNFLATVTLIISIL